MNKSVFLFFLCAVFTTMLKAQDFKVVEVKPDAMDISASTQRRYDAIQKPCALIKVYTTGKIQKAIGNVIGDIIDKGTVKWIYVTEGTDRLVLGFPNKEVLKVNFADYGVSDVQGLNTYTIVVSLKGKSQLDELTKFKLGESYESHGNYAKAAELYKIAADKGFADAQYRYARLYDMGIGVKQDQTLAFTYLLKAAEQGHAVSQNDVGLFYQEGKGGVNIDLVKGGAWIKKSALQGVPAAEGNLGYNYEKGEGVPVDLSQALYWYKKGAEDGNANAQHNYARFLYEGKATTKNVAEAKIWAEKAANQGQVNGMIDLGVIYDSEGDYVHAFYWYQQAANHGDPIAQANVASMYFTGNGVNKDYTKAFYYFSKSAEKNIPEAQHIAGYMLFNGVGTSKDVVKGFSLYQQAANVGNVNAQKTMAQLYENGIYVPKNLQTAIEWYKKAAAQGEQESIQHLKQLGVR